MDRIQYFLQGEVDCKFFLATEHWKTAEQLKSLPIKNFKLAAHWCRKEGEHGGAAVFVHNSIKYTERPKIGDFSVKGEMECAAVECLISGEVIIVIAMYRPFNGNKDMFLDLLEQLLTSIHNENKTIILGGDLNIYLDRDNKHRTELLSLLDSFSLCKHIEGYTRIKDNTKSSIDKTYLAT